MEFSVLASSSKGNVVYLSDGETRVLVDCGLSARETTRRLAELGVAAEMISAVVVTHEHSDHVRGITNFVRKYQLPVYVTEKTAQASKVVSALPQGDCCYFSSGECFSIGDLLFSSHPVQHDAADPVAFTIRSQHASLGVLTDIGSVTDGVRGHFSNLDALVVEANHDPLLLDEAPYPRALKKRIRGRWGHLSNAEAGELVRDVVSGQGMQLQVVIAAHISENSNCPELAIEELRSALPSDAGTAEPRFFAASAYQSTPLWQLASGLSKDDLRLEEGR